MAITNIDTFKKKAKTFSLENDDGALNNVERYIQLEQDQDELSSITTMSVNLENMIEKHKRLKDAKILNKNDFRHGILEGLIEENEKIIKKPMKSENDTKNFFYGYIEFISLIGEIGYDNDKK